MKHSLIPVPTFIYLLCALHAAFSEAQSLKAYTNPLKGDIGAHDPVMIKQDSTYYVFCTGAFVPIKTSRDRITWKQSGTVLKSTPSWFKTYVPENDGKDCWAPDISCRNGKYWLYYSVSTFGKRVSAIGLATTPTLDQASPDYKWTDEGMVINSTNSNNYNCIDANLFVDTDGKVWLDFGSWNSGIKMVELDGATGKLTTGNPAVLSIAARKSTATGIEAPFIIKQAVYYYLFVSWDVCCKGIESTYNIRAGRASKVTGPYSDKTNLAMGGGGGTLIDDGDERWVGPGHNGILVEHDTVFLVNHAYDAQDNGNPKLMIRPLYWDSLGWPTLDASKGQATGAAARANLPVTGAVPTEIRPVMIMGRELSAINTATPLFRLDGRTVVRRNDAVMHPGVYLMRSGN